MVEPTSSASLDGLWDSRNRRRDPPSDRDMHQLEIAFARVFSGADGDRVWQHLKTVTIGRVLSPDVSDSALRFHEGQRALVHQVAGMIERGRTGS